MLCVVAAASGFRDWRAQYGMFGMNTGCDRAWINGAFAGGGENDGFPIRRSGADVIGGEPRDV